MRITAPRETVARSLTYIMSSYTCDRYDTYEWVVCQVWMSHVTYMKATRETYESTMSKFERDISHVFDVTSECRALVYQSHVWMSHVTRMQESCHAYKWILSHIWISQVTHMNKSCHTYEWVMSHVWMSHGTHMNESCQTHEWVMSHVWMSHVTRIHRYQQTSCARVPVTRMIESCHTLKPPCDIMKAPFHNLKQTCHTYPTYY